MRIPGLRTAASSLAVTLVVLGVIEASLRLLPAPPRKPDPRASMPAFADRAAAEEILAETAGLRVEYAPFVFWRLAPRQSGRHFTIDGRGFRGQGGACPEGRPRVLIVGGSQAWGVGASSDRTTIGGYLEEALRLEGRDVCVFNAAQPGYVLRQVRIQLFDELLEEPWDAVLVLSGFNDVVATLQNQAVGDVQNSYRFRQRFDTNPGLMSAGRDFFRLLLSSSRLLDRLGVSPGRGLPPRSAPALPSATTGEGLEPLLEEMAREFVHDARIISTVCQERGIRVTFVLEPCLPVDKPATPAESATLSRLEATHPLYLPGLRTGYARLRDGLAPAAGKGLDFFDASKVFEHERGDVYIDEIHLSDRGYRAVAEALAHHGAPWAARVQ